MKNPSPGRRVGDASRPTSGPLGYVLATGYGAYAQVRQVIERSFKHPVQDGRRGTRASSRNAEVSTFGLEGGPHAA
jgi:hypothetical protein